MATSVVEVGSPSKAMASIGMTAFVGSRLPLKNQASKPLMDVKASVSAPSRMVYLDLIISGLSCHADPVTGHLNCLPDQVNRLSLR